MTTPTTIQEAIEDNALGPQSVSVGGQTVVQKPISEQIAADNYLRARTAASNTSFGLRFTRLKPPGGG